MFNICRIYKYKYTHIRSVHTDTKCLLITIDKFVTKRNYLYIGRYESIYGQLVCGEKKKTKTNDDLWFHPKDTFLNCIQYPYVSKLIIFAIRNIIYD